MMDSINRLLFGRFPRYVGTPNQFVVFDEPSFDLFRGANGGKSPCYSRISYLNNELESVVDRVLLDLDVDERKDMSDTELVSRLRRDGSFAESFYDDVIGDIRSVAELLIDESIPAVGVFTGRGMHIHVLYEERIEPKVELKSQTDWILDSAGVQSFDRKVRGDVNRLSRVANCERYDTQLNRSVGLYTIPVSVREMRDITARELVSWSEEKRSIELPSESRPPLLEHPDYQIAGSSNREIDVAKSEVGIRSDDLDDQFEKWIRDILKMPCLYERLMTRNPNHYVRMYAAVSFLNAGLGVDAIVDIFRRLNWADWDAEVTRKQVEQIRKEGYPSVGCEWMQEQGLCVYARGNRHDECDEYGFRGGVQEY